jgi:hypothetical protein
MCIHIRKSAEALIADPLTIPVLSPRPREPQAPAPVAARG